MRGFPPAYAAALATLCLGGLYWAISGSQVSNTRTMYSLPVIHAGQMEGSQYRWDMLNDDISRMAASSATFYMTKTELDLYLEFNTAPATGLGRQVTADDVVVVLKTSEECKSRVDAARQTWMKWAKHIYIISDKADEKLGLMTFPASENFTFGPDTLQGHHYYHFLGYLWESKQEMFNKPYFVLCDDDTWVNMPHVLRFLQPYSPDLKVMFTGLQINPGKTDGCAEYNQNCNDTGIAWGGGGAGVILTRAAMSLMASMVSNGQCPWLSHDDLSWSRCAASGAHVPQVVTSAFDMAATGHNEYHPPLAMLTIHKVFPDCQATDRGGEIAQLKRWTCSAAKRYRINEHAIPECSDPAYRDANAYYKNRQ